MTRFSGSNSRRAASMSRSASSFRNPTKIGSLLTGLGRMPELVRVRFPTQAPGQRAGIEVVFLDPLDENRPTPACECPSGSQRPSSFPGGWWRVARQTSTPADMTNSKAKGVPFFWRIPSSFLSTQPGRSQQRRRGRGIVRVGFDVGVIHGAVDIEGSRHDGSKPEEDPLQDRFPRSTSMVMARRTPLVCEKGTFHVPCNVAVGRQDSI